MTTTLIAKRTRVGGRIETEGDVVIEGRLEGTIVAGGTVTVGNTGVAVSDIQSGRVVVLGIVIGNIVAAERVDVASSARIVGDVRAPVVSVAPPAVIEGRVETATPPAPTPAPAPAPASAPPSPSRPAAAVTAPASVSSSGTLTQPPYVQRPTLKIRGAAVVRPARPESQSMPALPDTQPLGPVRGNPEPVAGPRLRSRDSSVVPLPPRPAARAHATPRRAPGE